MPLVVEGGKGVVDAAAGGNEGAEVGAAKGFGGGADGGWAKGLVGGSAGTWAKGVGSGGWEGDLNAVGWELLGAGSWLKGLGEGAVFAAKVPKGEGLGCVVLNPEGWPNAEEGAVGGPKVAIGRPSVVGWPNDDGCPNVDDGCPKALGCWPNAEGCPNVELGPDG